MQAIYQSQNQCLIQSILFLFHEVSRVYAQYHDSHNCDSLQDSVCWNHIAVSFNCYEFDWLHQWAKPKYHST